MDFYFMQEKLLTKILKKLYKEASSFGSNYGKNNLGIIYKYGYDEKIKKNIAYSIEYFEEAIRQKKWFIIYVYNLAHIYIYDKEVKQDINKAIKLLILSPEKLYHSCFLLSIILIKIFYIKYIEYKLSEITDNSLNLPLKVKVILKA